MAPLNWSSLGSLLAIAMVVRAAVLDVLRSEKHGLMRAVLGRAAAALVRRPRDADAAVVVVHETDANGVPNELYDAAELYLGAGRIVRRGVAAAGLARRRARHVPGRPRVVDVAVRPSGGRVPAHARPPRARVRAAGARHGGAAATAAVPGAPVPAPRRATVLDAYIPHVVAEAAAIRLKMRERKLYTNNPVYCGGGGGPDDHQMLWSSHAFAHPSTFDTLAIDPALRDGIRADLLRFVRRREHYVRAGRAWKRGYLLHGPPGTGKTSLIAATANLFEFDIYGLELTAVGSNSDLRRLVAEIAGGRAAARMGGGTGGGRVAAREEGRRLQEGGGADGRRRGRRTAGAGGGWAAAR